MQIKKVIVTLNYGAGSGTPDYKLIKMAAQIKGVEIEEFVKKATAEEAKKVIAEAIKTE